MRATILLLFYTAATTAATAAAATYAYNTSHILIRKSHVSIQIQSKTTTNNERVLSRRPLAVGGISGPFVFFGVLGVAWAAVWAFTATTFPAQSSKAG